VVEIEHRHGITAPLVALTYDDGPSDWTDQILDHFAEHDGRATFFVLGNAIDGEPRRETLRRAVAEGHELGNHTFTHPGDLSALDEAGIRDEIDRAQTAIRETAGVEPLHWRTPFLRTSDRLLEVVGSLGLTHVGCSSMPGDWDMDAGKISERVRKFLRPGAVIVLHDGRPADEPAHLSRPTREETVKATELILEDMSRLGLHAVTVTELVAADGD
jgi:peptidoglycan/xylan/chitin deacetylase (PgdA/CDA1 family)